MSPRKTTAAFTPIAGVCVDCNIAGVTQVPCKHQCAGDRSNVARPMRSAVEPSADDECTGAGQCHGCLKWCSACGDVKHVCDMRIRGDRCDEHPVPPAWHLIRVERRIAEKMIADGRRMVSEGEVLLGTVVDIENARREWDMQSQKEERRAFEVPR